MALNLDIRAPLIVLVADFNPSIFKAPWIAKHLFGREEGEQMALVEVLIQNGASLMPLSFLDGIAFNVTPNRTELLALDAQPATLSRLEEILLKMLATLPHTPLSAIGCNLTFVDDDPAEDVEALFATPEGLEGEGVLNTRQLGIQLQMDGDSVLNFSRTLTPQEVRYAFNYHRAESDPDKYKEFIPGLIAKCLEHSQGILSSMYGYGGYGVLGFAPAQEDGGDDVVQDAG